MTAFFVALAVVFLKYGRHGLYLRVTGSDADVLKAKGVNPGNLRSLSWCLAALYASLAGILLTLRLSSFVPNISSGRGWMALAAVFLGKKKPLRIVAAVIIFCLADIFAANIPQQISKDGEASFGNRFTEKSLDKSGRWKEFGEHIEATMPKT